MISVALSNTGWRYLEANGSPTLYVCYLPTENCGTVNFAEKKECAITVKHGFTVMENGAAIQICNYGTNFNVKRNHNQRCQNRTLFHRIFFILTDALCPFPLKSFLYFEILEAGTFIVALGEMFLKAFFPTVFIFVDCMRMDFNFLQFKNASFPMPVMFCPMVMAVNFLQL